MKILRTIGIILPARYLSLAHPALNVDPSGDPGLDAMSDEPLQYLQRKPTTRPPDVVPHSHD